MRKSLHVLMAAGLILTFAAILGGMLHTATSDRQEPTEVPAQPANDSNPPPSAQSDVPDLGTSIPIQSPEAQRPTLPPGTESLVEALDSYDELYQAIFAQKGGSGEQYKELGRRRQVLASLLISLIDAGVQRKYKRRPPFQDYPVAIDDVVEMIYTKPCRGCVNIDFEILAPIDVIEGRAPGYLPYDGFRFSLHCPAKMNIDLKAANDEVFVEDLSNNYCFEPISRPADQNGASPSGQP
jgi:hypothetical protein